MRLSRQVRVSTEYYQLPIGAADDIGLGVVDTGPGAGPRGHGYIRTVTMNLKTRSDECEAHPSTAKIELASLAAPAAKPTPACSSGAPQADCTSATSSSASTRGVENGSPSVRKNGGRPKGSKDKVKRKPGGGRPKGSKDKKQRMRRITDTHDGESLPVPVLLVIGP